MEIKHHTLLFNKNPDYNILRVFGCLCYAKNNKISHKFESRVIKGVLIRYSTLTKKYKILDLEKDTILINRNVTFYKTIFSFKTTLKLRKQS